MDTLESNRQLALLEERYHQIHRHTLRIRARQGSEDEIAEAQRDQRAILVAIEEIEQHLID